MKLQYGKTYSRRQISAALGGSMRAYLPTSKGVVVCGCFKRVPHLNPRAPEEVLFGFGPVVQEEARLVAAQRGPIPIFIYRKSKEWEYVGDFLCTGMTTDRDVLSQKEKKYPLRGRIAGVLTFKMATASRRS